MQLLNSFVSTQYSLQFRKQKIFNFYFGFVSLNAKVKEPKIYWTTINCLPSYETPILLYNQYKNYSMLNIRRNVVYL